MSGIIDIHQHVGGLLGIPGIEIEEATPERDRTVRLAVMDRFGIGRAALMPGHSYGTPRGLADTRAANNRLIACQEGAADRFPALLGTVEPRQGRAALEELDRLASLGFKGVSWHHRMQGLPMDHPVMLDILDVMASAGMVPFIHCYVQADFEEFWRLERLARQFPSMPFIALDSMTAVHHFEAALALGEAARNVHFDLASSAVGAAGINALVTRLGPDRLLFGTNLYSMMDHEVMPELIALDEARLPPGDRALIAAGNAVRLLDL